MFFKRKEYFDSPYDFVICGLGNPGSEYADTRHNAGFMATETFVERAIKGEMHKIDGREIKFYGGVAIKKLKFKSLCGVAEISLNDNSLHKKILIIEPQTYMNLSGDAVEQALAFYKIPPERLIVFSDDVNFDVGKVKLKERGSDGGHNGIRNIIIRLDSSNFPRVKIGVGSKPPEWILSDWVLSHFPKTDGDSLIKSFNDAVDKAAKYIIEFKD